ncbi:hypothetical protein BYT27DRAFT_7200110, partial [Phlegmacium glaucopus]
MQDNERLMKMKKVNNHQTFSTPTARRRTGLFNADKTLKQTRKWTQMGTSD